jgi:hypothetical protein
VNEQQHLIGDKTQNSLLTGLNTVVAGYTATQEVRELLKGISNISDAVNLFSTVYRIEIKLGTLLLSLQTY